MQEVEHALVAFFKNIAKKDPGLLKELNQYPRFKVEQGSWTFTLPDLHLFLRCQQNELFESIEYKQFRSVIFNSAINQAVKANGAEIVISRNLDKVDKSEYALVWEVSDK